MKHLVTGGSGFLGALIAGRLFGRGEAVRVLDIWDDPNRPKGIEFIHCDIRNHEGVAAAMRGVEIVHHNAALVPLTKSGTRFWEVNVEGSRIVAEKAAKAGVKAFIHMSSSAIFGSPEKCPITTETPAKPAEIYGRAKWAGELAVREVLERAGLALIVIRPRTILGEGRLGIFQILFEWIQQGRNVYVMGSGNNKYQFVHASDLMDAYMLALDLRKPGVYNVGTDRFGTMRETLERLIAHAKSRSRLRFVPVGPTIAALKLLDALGVSPLAPYHWLAYHKDYYFDLAPLFKLGWKPKYSNDEMFRDCYDWFTSNSERLAAEKTQSANRAPVKEGFLWLVKHLP
jgi:nucleoside-diphosphate-sugar epimerase